MRIKRELERYLRDTLGFSATISQWGKSENLPFALRNQYEFYLLGIEQKEFLLGHAIAKENPTPATLEKHASLLEGSEGKRIIFLFNSLEPYNRKRLIERKIPFIVPAHQLYLMDLGIDFREYTKKQTERKTHLSPYAQLLLFAYLLNTPKVENWTATGLANHLGSHKMNMSRAIEDLDAHNLVSISQEGREKFIKFPKDKKSLWDKVFPHLRTPVLKKIYLEAVDIQGLGLLAGVSGLAELTMLAESHKVTYAVTEKDWKKLQLNTEIRMIPKASSNLAPIELEIWRYDPRVISCRRNTVDPLSLYLSLSNEKDERIEGEREKLLEDIEW